MLEKTSASPARHSFAWPSHHIDASVSLLKWEMGRLREAALQLLLPLTVKIRTTAIAAAIIAAPVFGGCAMELGSEAGEEETRKG